MTSTLQYAVNLQGIEAATLYVEPIFTGPDIRSIFRVLPMAQRKQKLGFVTELEKIVRKYAGCGFNPVGGVSVYDRTIMWDMMSADVEQCADEFMATVYEQLLNRGVSYADLTGTVLQSIIEDMVRMGIQKDIRRLAFWGDETSADPSINPIDGLWTILKGAAGATTPLLPRTNSNSGTALASGDGLDLLREVTEQADIRLKALPPAQTDILVTGSVYERYVNDIENGGGGDMGQMLVVNGFPTPTFRGRIVTPMWEWDAQAGAANQHMVYYGAKGNLVLSTNLTEGETQIKTWFNEEDEKFKVKTRFPLGFNYVHPMLMSVAY